MQSWIGTSGFQYPEWKGKFYPETMPPAKMLTFYSGVFNSTEVNYTFRRIPTAKTIKRWHDETPEDFRYSLKAPQRITHFARLKDCREVVKTFQAAVKGLGKKLGPVLFQLPATFKADDVLLREFVGKLPKGLRAAFEFRHESWLSDRIYEILASKNIALCIAESEEFETPKVATADFGYLRIRREDYTAPQLRKWAKFVGEQSKTWSNVFVYFKHEETCVGPEFAKTFMKALAKVS